MTVSASFGLAGCAAINDLKVSIFQWFDTVNFTGEGEVLPGKSARGGSCDRAGENPKTGRQGTKEEDQGGGA
jgi:hypothetical protein